MRSTKIAAIAIAAASVVVTPALTGSADAVTACSSGYHCYGEDQLEGNGSYPSAAGTDLKVDCLGVSDPNSQFANWEMWFATNTPQVSYDTWVEEGMTYGSLQSGQVGFMWYWADERPNGGYSEHYIQNASGGSTTNVSVYYAGSNNDDVYLGGSYVGTSTGNGSGGLYANAGAEVTTTNTHVNGSSNNFQYQNSSGWHSATPNPYDNSGGLWSTYTSGSYLWVNTGCNTPAASTKPEATSMPSNAEQVRRILAGIGRHAASRTHESKPSSIRMAKSTRHQALSLLGGDKVNGNQAVYAVQLKGTFSSFRRAPQHKKGRIPAGNTLTVLVDAATGQVTDWSITNTSADTLTRLGPVTTLA